MMTKSAENVACFMLLYMLCMNNFWENIFATENTPGGGGVISTQSCIPIGTRNFKKNSHPRTKN
jgi:hypothetical protein